MDETIAHAVIRRQLRSRLRSVKESTVSVETAIATLNIPGFGQLWISNGLSQFAVQLLNFAQGWLILELTNSSFWIGANRGFPIVPVILAALVGGAVVDRFSRRTLLIQARLMTALLIAIIAFLTTLGLVQLWQVLLAFTLVSIVSAISYPASQTLLVDIVGRGNLVSALALSSLIQGAATIVIPPLGGIISDILGTEYVFYVLSAIYIVAALTLVSMTQSSKIQISTVTKNRILRDILDGLTYARKNPQITWLLFLSVVALFSNVYLPLMPIYSRDILGVGVTGFGLLLAAQGAGSVAGSAYMSIMRRMDRKGRVLVLSSITFALAMIAFGFSRIFFLSIVCSLIMGCAAVIWANTLTALLLVAASSEMRGRVLSILRITSQLLPLGWALGGAMAGIVGNELTILIGGVLVISLNFLAYSQSATLRSHARDEHSGRSLPTHDA